MDRKDFSEHMAHEGEQPSGLCDEIIRVSATVTQNRRRWRAGPHQVGSRFPFLPEQLTQGLWDGSDVVKTSPGLPAIQGNEHKRNSQ